MNKPFGNRWTIARLLQFEQCQSRDKHSDAHSITARDRALFHSLADSERTRPRAYLAWLQDCLSRSPLLPDAGDMFARAYQVSTLLLVLMGLLLGSALCFGALNYDGTVPINVALFLALIVLPQLLMLALLLLSVVFSLLNSGWFRAWYRPLAALGRRLLGWSWQVFGAKPGGEDRNDALLSAEIFNQCFGLHGSLFATRVLRMFQVMGMAFNIGVIVSLVLLLAITDRSFGWQSSLTDSASTVAQLVAALAWPWRDIWGEGIGFPSLPQIQASRIFLDAESASLDNHALKAWWPFLLLCVLFYGLIPRLLAYLFAVVRERWLLSQVTFDAYHYQGLWRRMQSIELTSQGQPSPHSAEASQAQTPMANSSSDIANAYVLQDTLSRYSQGYLSRWLPSGQTQPSILATEQLSAIPSAASQPVYLIVEGWQPPIEEVLKAVTELAQRLAQDQSDLHLLLLGKPGAAGSKPISARLADVWRKKLDLYQQANIIVHAPIVDAPSHTAAGSS